MPKTIPCWNCKGPGCETCNGGGVLSVYTQEELDKKIKKSRDALKNILAAPKMINRTNGYKLNACVVIALKALKG